MISRGFRVRGAVQGVGFRPFVYRLAHELGVCGFVLNDEDGVWIEAQGAAPSLEAFERRLTTDAPVHARIDGVELAELNDRGQFTRFQIRPSPPRSRGTAGILPDLAVCEDCLSDVFDSGNRRHRYPFTNCTNCGPRFSILESLPYDRPNTTMAAFTLCAACQAEYDDPMDRRFHAQPNACPDCGPQVRLGELQAEDAIGEAVRLLSDGRVVAVKGLGGFHLLVNALDPTAISVLRERKARARKPFAVMFADRGQLMRHCAPTDLELGAVLSSVAPIVLMDSRGELPENIAPGSHLVGAMFPYTPLHHILLGDAGFPVVATSANSAGEPICIDLQMARASLEAVADGVLDHDRPIRRPVEDSVMAQYEDSMVVLRRGRGLAPSPVSRATSDGFLGRGAQLRTALAVSHGGQIIAGPHIGTLTTEVDVLDTYARAVRDFEELFEPRHTVVDLHPDLLSRRQLTTVTEVQHHHAHAAACMVEHGVDVALAVVWDGTGYGPDGSIWGGEFLDATLSTFERVAHLRTFRLPGGEAAILHPARQADALRFELGRSCQDSRIEAVLQGGINCPETSAAGRLFDAVSAILGFAPDRVEFDGEPAIALEHGARGADAASLPTPSLEGEVVDWGPLIAAILDSDAARSALAAGFHLALARAIVDVAASFERRVVVLTGGCFQNRLLLETTARRLREAGLEPVWPREVPPNDGGIAVGQVVVAAARAG